MVPQDQIAELMGYLIKFLIPTFIDPICWSELGVGVVPVFATLSYGDSKVYRMSCKVTDF